MSIKKFISIGLITCMGVGICYNNTYALDDSFLKFLINSSYPEAKVEISNDNKDKKDAEKITDKKENEENTSDKVDNKDEDEFIKMYVGEENMPATQVSLNSMTKGVYISNPLYTSNILTTSDKPQILIYHTHGGETYSNSPEGNYHSEDKPNSTLEIGAMLTQELASRGRSIVHNTTYHDLPDFNSAYTRSLKTIQNMQAKYGSIDIVIDLHRDGRDFNKISKEEFHKQTTTTIDGKDVAKFLFVVGEKSQNSKRISELAEDITKFAETKYPGITKPVVRKDYARFNQFTSDNHLLLEVGGNANSIEEAKASIPYIAEIIDEYFKKQGI
ncbi:MAG: stage II sporulation protein P [Peptostreptococcaceae bacterium]|nr:stage II sporulation protein P [Peptostreptococcaceae bacterium]MBP3930023.1 stage II sporulation protein P [Peptostreptococcaceae bacterium]